MYRFHIVVFAAFVGIFLRTFVPDRRLRDIWGNARWCIHRSNPALYAGHFRQFDLGNKKNLRVYGTETPPDYPTKLITAEMHPWCGDSDEMSAVEDVLRVAETFPNKVMHHLEDPLWDHMDFANNWEVRQYINDPIIAILNEYESK